jgi:hypothetical protein
VWLGFEPASPCSPTWYCQIPPPTLAPSEVLNGNTTDVLDVGEITNQEHSPERAIPSEKKRQQNCSFSLSYYAILLGPPFLDTIHYFLASMNHF